MWGGGVLAKRLRSGDGGDRFAHVRYSTEGMPPILRHRDGSGSVFVFLSGQAAIAIEGSG